MASALLGRAVTLSGMQAAGSSSYGSQSRGGVTRADVVIEGSGFIGFPHVTRPDVLVAMSDEAYRHFLPGVAAHGVVLYDGYYVRPDPGDGHPHLEVEATRLALDALGRAVAANIVMLGALVGLKGLVDEAHLTEVLHTTFPERFHAANDTALGLGLGRGRALARGGA
jgi:2-oxoglutarate ferredoxin oxidoreductase subunit gamma